MYTALMILVVTEAALVLVAALRGSTAGVVLLGALLVGTTAYAYALQQRWIDNQEAALILKLAIPIVKVCAMILVVPFLWWRKRRRGDSTAYRTEPPGAGWEPTAERFVEAGTQNVVSIWFNPATGERAYVRA